MEKSYELKEKENEICKNQSDFSDHRKEKSMVDVLPEWTVRGVMSSECVERKDGSELHRDVQRQTERKQVSLNATPANKCTRV